MTRKNHISSFVSKKQVNGSLYVLFLCFTLFTACNNPESEIRSVSDEIATSDADSIRASVSLTIADGLDLSLWASEKLLGDLIAIDVDDYGRAFVTVTNRSTNSEFDVRSLPDHWVDSSMTWTTVEDRRRFLRNELTPERSEENDFVWDLNEDGIHDWTDLTVEQEEVWTVQDLSGDGLADQAQLYIRDFNEEITDVAGALAYHDGDIFLGVGPDMWRLQDTNNDGIADVKESISHGYNVHVGFSGHNMSGAITGPDGRIYWGIGDMGLNVVDQEGKRWAYPDRGSILRSNPDGSNFEVYAMGVRNTHEFVFDKYGNLISVDNDGDHAGEDERIVHLINGSDTGWRTHWQFGKYTDEKNNSYKVWMDEDYFVPRFENQAAHILPPIANHDPGPTGMAYNPGTALGEEWYDHFFIVSFRGSVNNSPLNAFTLSPNGVSYELEEDKEVLNGILPVGIDFGPDGALYLTDWLQGWGRKEMGRIWKLDSASDVNSPIRIETKNLLAEDFSSRPSEELGRLMEHEDMRVRQKAQFELADRSDTDALLSVAENSGNQLARIHSIWGIAQIGRRQADAVEPLINLLGDSDPEIRAQAAKMLGDVRYEPAGDPLISLLSDDNARARFYATEALGRIAYRPALESIVEMLEANNDEDIYLRQGGAIALERIGDGDTVAGLSDHPSRAVRIAAIVTLKRLAHPGAAEFLNDDDEFIVTNAARAINDDEFIEEALPALAAMLDQERFVNEPLMRRAINANVYIGDAASAQRLATFSNRENIDESLRVEALGALTNWETPSVYDRVTGKYRGQIQNDPDAAREALAPVVDDLLASESSDIRIAVAESMSGLGFSSGTSTLLALLTGDPSPDVRIGALEALSELGYADIADAIRTALEDSEESVRLEALSMVSELGLPDQTTVDLLVSRMDGGSVEEQQTVIETLGEMENSPAAVSALNEQLARLSAGEIPLELQLDLLDAIEDMNNSDLNERVAQYHASKPQDDPVALYRESLQGGSFFQGRQIFFQNQAAQCIRCHIVNGQGGEVGPNLSDVGSRLSREELLQSLVQPGLRPVTGFSIMILTLNNGETVQGVFASENGTSVTLSQSGGSTTTIQKSDISERTLAPSAMPNMSQVLSRGELRNVVEYLTTLNGDN